MAKTSDTIRVGVTFNFSSIQTMAMLTTQDKHNLCGQKVARL